MKFNRSVRAFEVPHTATALLLAVNIVVYALTLQRSGLSAPSPGVLLRAGAMYSGVLARHEYWRLVAYAFLHASMLHILTNMAFLVWWGGPLEGRIGASYFLLIYFVSVIAGALAGVVTHPGIYFTVGASAGISGVLGALLCLKLLKRIDLPASFFAINIGINVAIALFAPSLDWGAHIGGFVTGMAVCAVTDRFEVAGAKLMRCKFPEFIKLNLGVLIAVLAWLTDFSPVTMLAVLLALTIVAKGIDVALSQPRGLAWTVAILAVGNALVAGAVMLLTLPATGPISLPPSLVPWAASALRRVIAAASSLPDVSTLIVFAAVCGLSCLLYWPELMRGLNDKGGFAAASFRAERGRRRGL